MARTGRATAARGETTGALVGCLRSHDWDFRDARTAGHSHAMHPYPAKFIPQIPRTLIAELSEPGEMVADIFCGSGTTLVEAALAGRRAIGVDANPLACLISRAKTSVLSDADAVELGSVRARATCLAAELSASHGPPGDARNRFRSRAWRPDDETLDFWFDDFVVEELAEALEYCRSLESHVARTLALTAFSAIVVAVSKQDSDTRYVRREKDLAPGDTLRRFGRSIESVREGAMSFSEACDGDTSVRIEHANVLDAPDIGTVDLLVSSPPYPNAYSYHLYHRTRMLWLGMDQPTFKRDEIGSHRKYSARGAKAISIETFAREMKQVFGYIGQWVRPDGHACFVVGDSTIAGRRFDNAEVLADAASDAGFTELVRLERTLQKTRKAFNPKIGKIATEKILVFRAPRA